MRRNGRPRKGERQNPCAPTCSTSSCPPTASRCGRRARAMRRGCWWCGRARHRRARTARARSAELLRAGRPARCQRHQGHRGAASRPAHRPGGVEAGIEATLIKRLDGARWQALVKPARKLAVGDVVRFGAEGSVCFLEELDAAVEAKGEAGEITLAFAFTGPLSTPRLRARGEVPLPPYIAAAARPTSRTAPTTRRCSPATTARSPRRPPGCISRRTLLARSPARASRSHGVTLHVGAGTFLPVKADDTDEHKMHAEMGTMIAADRRRRSTRRARQAAGSSRSAPPRCACSKARRATTARIAAVRRRDRHLHHAGLPVPRGRPAADQFPPAALDPVHAGRRPSPAWTRCRRPMPMPSQRATASIPTAMLSVVRRRP